MGKVPHASGCGPWLSWRLTPEMPIDIGSPFRSVTRWIFDPNLLRPVGFDPVKIPLLSPWH